MAENKFDTVGDARVQTMVSCPFYTVKKICLKGEAELSMDGAYQLFSVIGGSGTIDGTSVKKGDHFILPTGYETYKLSGEMELMTSFTRGEI
jgi:mannose-6-phosphate isomerase class I